MSSWDAETSKLFGHDTVDQCGGEFPILQDDKKRVQLSIRQCLKKNEAFDIECRIVRADGAIRWVQAKATVLGPCGGPQRDLAGIIADITDRKNAETKLREAEERYRLISQTTMDFVYEWDFDEDRLSWNGAFERCFGHSPDQVETMDSLHGKIHPDDAEFVLREMRGLLESANSQIALEYRIMRSDGTYANVYASSHIIRDPLGQPSRLIGALLDLSERKLADAAYKQSEALNHRIVEAVTECVMLIGLDGKLEFINGPGARAVGIQDPSLFYGQDWVSFWPARARKAVSAALSAALNGGNGAFAEATPTLHGVLKYWDVVISPVLTDGKPAKLVAIARDVTERKEAQEALVRAATRDALTGLMNRATFQEVLASRVAMARESGCQLGLMLLDLDHFKHINDAEGHDVGDHLLAVIAQRMREVAPANTKLARLGGDEFAVLMPDIGSGDEAVDMAGKLLERIRTPLVHDRRKLDCSATIGVAVFPDHGRTQEELLKSADIALYVAKNQGRGRAALFESHHRAEIQARQSMLSLARAAIRNQRIVPFYQPKIQLPDRQLHGFEALLRWHDVRRGIQFPSTIAAAFDDLDLAATISDHMIDRVIEDMRCWLDEGLAFGHVAVNAAAAEFRRDNFAESVLDRLASAGVPSSRFQLEVTETVFLGRGSEYVDRALKLLSREGVSIALDDFGTGFASLRHLKDFPVDVIKLDQSFVRDMKKDPDDAAIVGAVLNLGRSLEIEVVAEGIETAEQEQRLRELGCRYGQGFLYSEAVPASAAADIIRRMMKQGLPA
ncbi:EAL domain-containing protein [Novosphingobium sp. 9U]|uniref:bifunctional diguanylate cyclase/phosphodiesterase n=1 Tax=Novosphingobium sp. 9U TaxID=2653158 RepID=UPI001357A65C|nr:EAL domain-containing protein [Novosphingobium sp. 9U]